MIFSNFVDSRIYPFTYMYAKTNISNANCSETIETMKMVEFSLKSIEKILGKRNRPFFLGGGAGIWGMVRRGKGSGI